MRRRSFLQTTAAFALPTFIPASVFASANQPGANDRVRVGIAGLGGRARWILLNEDLPGAQIAAVADCFTPRVAETITQVATHRELHRLCTHAREAGV